MNQTKLIVMRWEDKRNNLYAASYILPRFTTQSVFYAQRLTLLARIDVYLKIVHSNVTNMNKLMVLCVWGPICGEKKGGIFWLGKKKKKMRHFISQEWDWKNGRWWLCAIMLFGRTTYKNSYVAWEQNIHIQFSRFHTRKLNMYVLFLMRNKMSTHGLFIKLKFSFPHSKMSMNLTFISIYYVCIAFIYVMVAYHSVFFSFHYCFDEIWSGFREI